MFSKCYIIKLTLILSLLTLLQGHAGPLFDNGYGAGNASFSMGFGTGTSRYGGIRSASSTYPNGADNLYGRALNRRVESVI